MDLASEKSRLLKRDAEWAAAASAGRDVERLLPFWTDDAVVFAPGLPIVAGKEALRAYVEGSLQIPGFHVTWTSDEVKFSPDLNIAYMFSRNVLTMNGPDGAQIKIEGRAVTIWRREADNEWRCAVDIWNSEAAPTQVVGPDKKERVI